MLVRHINFCKWHSAYVLMRTFEYDGIIVEERYNYKKSEIGQNDVRNFWVYAILQMENNPVMVTCLCDPCLAYSTQHQLLKHLRAHPEEWLERDDVTLLSEPVLPQGTVDVSLEHAASGPEFAFRDLFP